MVDVAEVEIPRDEAEKTDTPAPEERDDVDIKYGLTVDPDSASSPDYDVVAVHGFSGGSKSTWPGAPERWDWIKERFFEHKTVRAMYYDYDIDEASGAIYTRQGLRGAAMKLLDELLELREPKENTNADDLADDGSAKNEQVEDEPAKDGPAKEDLPEEDLGKDDLAKEGHPREDLAKADPAKERAPEEDSAEVDPTGENSPKEDSVKNDPADDTSSKDGSHSIADGPDPSRPLVFVSHDLGGIVVKQALILATLDPLKYGKILSSTAAIVFFGCPHRCQDSKDMEESITRLLFFYDKPVGHNILRAVKGLSDSIVEINASFIDTKLLLRLSTTNVYSALAEDYIFDKFAATMNIPFENRVSADRTHDQGVRGSDNFHRTIGELLGRIPYPTEITPALSRCLPIILSQASPIYPLTTCNDSFLFQDPEVGWIEKDETLQTWMSRKDATILHVYGTESITKSSETLFHFIDSRINSQTDHSVLYFQFLKQDGRFRTIRSLLTTFLAQILCHYTNLEQWVIFGVEQLILHASWSDKDLFEFWVGLQSGSQLGGITYIIAGIELCDDSKDWFLDELIKFTKRSETCFKVIITGKGRQESLADLPSIDLDERYEVDTLKRDKALDNVVNFEIMQLFQRRPQYSPLEQKLREVLSECGDDYRRRRLIIDWLNFANKCGTKSATKERLESLSPVTVPSVVSMIIKSIPPEKQLWAHKILTWVLCASRPLSFWELQHALLFGADDEEVDLEDILFPNIANELQSYFGTMLYFLDSEICFGHPDLRDTLAESASPSVDTRYENHAQLHEEITVSCLRYLSQSPVQERALEFYDRNRDQRDHPIDESRSDLLYYASRYWPVHRKLALINGAESALLETQVTKFLENAEVRTAWTGVFYVLSNPTIVASPKLFPHLSTLSTLGFTSRVKQYIERTDQHGESFNEDCSAALIEAARHGHIDVVEILLQHSKPTQSDLRDVIAVATPNTMLALLQYSFSSIGSFDVIGGNGRADPVSKAAWLGLTDVVEYLVKAGAELNPDTTLCKISPLHLAARNNHAEVVKLLLGTEATGKKILETASIRGHTDIVKLLTGNTNAIVHAPEEDEIEDWKPLQFACYHGHHQVAKILLEGGADGNHSPRDGDQPLFLALRKGHLECCRALLDHGAAAEPFATDLTIRSPLYLAVDGGYLDICKLLLEKGADPNKKHDYSAPILHVAVQQGNLKIVEELLKRDDVDVNQVDSSSYLKSTPLSRAAEEGFKEIANLLLEKGAKVDFSGSPDSAPIYVAAREGHVELVRLLAEAGANVNAPAKGGWCPLHIAYDFPEVAKALLEYKADINILSDDGTPLFLASRWDHPDVVQVYLDHKPDLEIGLKREGYYIGMTPLTIAVEQNNTEIVRKLLEAGADVNTLTARGRCPLFFALIRATEDDAMVRLLLEYNPILTVVDQYGDTALHCMGMKTPVSAVRLLVNAGADPEIGNKRGYTALGIAAREKNTEVVKYLLQKKARVNIVTSKSEGPLHLACSWGNLETVKLLVENNPPADVNQPCPGVWGTPLQCVCYRSHLDDDSPELAIPMARYLLEEAKADINTFAGQYGYALNAACLRASLDMIELLLEHNAIVDVEDETGRKPIHLASFRTVEYVNLLVESGKLLAGKDKLGRTPLHYAVVSGHLDTVKRVLDLAPESLDKPDADGWTPLLWCARKCGKWFTTQDELPEIIELLLARGADPWVRGEGLDREWSPPKVARYYGADEKIVELLTPKSKERVKGGEIEVWDDRYHLSKKAIVREDGFCDACLLCLAGNYFVCQSCYDTCLCFKCYRSRDTLHDGHAFEEVGPEYEAEPESSPERRPSIPYDDGATVLSLDEEDSEVEDDGDEDEMTGEVKVDESPHDGVNGNDEDEEEEDEDD